MTSPRKRLLLALLFTIVALAAFTAFGVHNPELGAPIPNSPLRASMLAVSALHRYSAQPANSPTPWLRSIGATGVSQAPQMLPIQFKDPSELGVGKLLVASRGDGDPNFAETVVLLVHFDQQGVVGLILNRRTNLPLSQILDLNAAKDRSDPVYLGGPVQTTIAFALVQSSTRIEKAQNVFGGVYWFSEKRLFNQILSTRPAPGAFHVYLGYAGWTPDQLRSEVQSGAWFILPASSAAVFNSNPDSLWLKMIKKTEMQWTMAEPSPGARIFSRKRRAQGNPERRGSPGDEPSLTGAL